MAISSVHWGGGLIYKEWPKGFPTSACRSLDQVVDTPYENPGLPRIREPRFSTSSARCAGGRVRPGENKNRHGAHKAAQLFRTMLR